MTQKSNRFLGKECVSGVRGGGQRKATGEGCFQYRNDGWLAKEHFQCVYEITMCERPAFFCAQCYGVHFFVRVASSPD